jgi:archaellum component FlaC
MKMIKVCTLILTLTTLIAIIPVNAQLTENLRVHVDLVQTFPSGNMTSTSIDGAKVTVTHLETGDRKVAFTADGGWARFWLNRTGQYNLTVSYMDCIHITKRFFIDDLNRTTYIWDSIYKLARFFAGDQLTIFQLIRVELPAVVVFKIPKYTNFTSHVDAYGGLRFAQSKLEDRYVFTPYDVTGPRYTEKGEIFYPNYTVTINFKTTEMGRIALMIGSNASYSVVADPLYSVPANVWVKIMFTVFTYIRPEIQQLNKIESMLETILSILLQIRDMINKTVIPKLNTIYDALTKLSNATLSKLKEISDSAIKGIADKTGLVYEKVKEIDTNVKMVRDTLNLFTSEFKQSVRQLFMEQTGDLKTTVYLGIGLAMFAAILVAVGTKVGKGGSRKEERSVIVK